VERGREGKEVFFYEGRVDVTRGGIARVGDEELEGGRGIRSLAGLERKKIFLYSSSEKERLRNKNGRGRGTSFFPQRGKREEASLLRKESAWTPKKKGLLLRNGRKKKKKEETT